LRNWLCVWAALLCAALPAWTYGQTPPILEASGIARQGDSLLLVDDGWRGLYYRFQLKGEKGPVIVLDPSRLEQVKLPQGSLATDLESIDVLNDGRVVVLSERLRALFSAKGVIADYDAHLSEFGKRGLEGVAVRPLPDRASEVAVLWEGGYPEYQHVPAQLRKKLGRRSMRPVIEIHRLNAGEQNVVVRGSRLVPLDVPRPRGREPKAQRFRAPDLVWQRQPDGRWGFIVLLSSENSVQRPHYMYHWLLRFSADGKRIGQPIDLDAMVPADLRGVNWEGLDWFEDGERLVLVHESHPNPKAVAYVVQLPDEWKQSAPTKN